MRSLRPTLVGRDPELTTLGAWWTQGGPLLCLVGAGGVGKTALMRCFADGLAAGEAAVDTLFVDLSACRSGDGVDATLAEACGSPVAERLGAGVLLLVDTVEQVVDAVAERVPRWVAAGARVLCTSRIPLDVVGEQVVTVRTLPVAGHIDSPAARLLCLRVRERTGRDPAPSDAAAVVDIVGRLDGLPLAIELAAARVKALGVSGLRDRLDSLLHRHAGRRPGRARHASLDAVIRWSWDLLLPEDQAVLAWSASFSGSFDLAAAEAVLPADDVVEVLDALVHHHLLELDERTDVPRYRLLSATRAFAARRLAERPDRHAAAAAHAAHFLRDGLEDARLDVILAEQADLRAVMARHLPVQTPHDQQQVLRAAWLLRPALMVHPLAPEVRAVVEAAVGGDLPVEWRARAGCVLGSERYFWGSLDDAAAAYAGAHALLQDVPRSSVRTAAASSLFATLLRQGRLDEAQPVGAAAVAAADALDPTSPLAFRCRYNLTALLHSRGELEAARSQALVLVQRFGHVPPLVGRALHTLGFIDFDRGDLHAAEARFRQCLEACPAADLFHLRCVGNLGMLHHIRGEVDAARARYLQAVEGLRALSCRGDEGEFRVALATLEGTAGNAAASAAQLVRAEQAFAVQHIDAEGWLLRLHHAVVDGVEGADRAALLAELAADPACASAWEVWFHKHLLGQGPRPAARLEVGLEGRWFRLRSAAAVDLSRRGAMRRILAGLADHRLAAPGEALDRAALFSAGWPGQTISEESAAHRVRVALSSLRKLGLEGVVVRYAEGWLLDPELPLVRGGERP